MCTLYRTYFSISVYWFLVPNMNDGLFYPSVSRYWKDVGIWLSILFLTSLFKFKSFLWLNNHNYREKLLSGVLLVQEKVLLFCRGSLSGKTVKKLPKLALSARFYLVTLGYKYATRMWSVSFNLIIIKIFSLLSTYLWKLISLIYG